MEAICMKQSRKTLPSTSARYWPLDLCMSEKKATVPICCMLTSSDLRPTDFGPASGSYFDSISS